LPNATAWIDNWRGLTTKNQFSAIIRPREADIGGLIVRRSLPVRQKRAIGPWIFFDQMGPADFNPGTGLDVIRMGLVKNTRLEREGTGYKATLTFRPSSPVCPMAFKLAWDMKQSAQAVQDIETVDIKVEGYNRAAELEAILKEGEEP